MPTSAPPPIDLQNRQDFTPHQQRIADLALGLAAELEGSSAEHDRTGAFALVHYEHLHTSGYLRLVIPKQYGGGGRQPL